VTEFGRALIARYREIQSKASGALADDLSDLAADCTEPDRPG
jgi:molybdenum-dependent DNA-binding transcriptional regulator ModE